VVITCLNIINFISKAAHIVFDMKRLMLGLRKCHVQRSISS
jgi:hypothetical protein